MHGCVVMKIANLCNVVLPADQRLADFLIAGHDGLKQSNDSLFIHLTLTECLFVLFVFVK